MKKGIIIFLFISVLQNYANAQGECSKVANDGGVFACFNSAKQAAEKTLNREYIAAKKRINAEYSASMADLKSYMTTLTDTQRGWLKYRDGQCSLESFMAEKGTLTHDTLTDKCVARIDLERVEQLKSMPYE
ncbi:lysozyme inhibitor LprI family protein [Pantoea sp. SM3]|uniref:lysozyme inhibitor LprI family protein n=1 Tax=Pantoea sp. SM3 TaxID=1628192 RepID=UPI000695B3D8|nr:lysozyme inhibitor LprI family protein [Pantoea sp. SM3]